MIVLFTFVAFCCGVLSCTAATPNGQNNLPPQQQLQLFLSLSFSDSSSVAAPQAYGPKEKDALLHTEAMPHRKFCIGPDGKVGLTDVSSTLSNDSIQQITLFHPIAPWLPVSDGGDEPQLNQPSLASQLASVSAPLLCHEPNKLKLLPNGYSADTPVESSTVLPQVTSITMKIINLHSVVDEEEADEFIFQPSPSPAPQQEATPEPANSLAAQQPVVPDSALPQQKNGVNEGVTSDFSATSQHNNQAHIASSLVN